MSGVRIWVAQKVSKSHRRKWIGVAEGRFVELGHNQLIVLKAVLQEVDVSIAFETEVESTGMDLMRSGPRRRQMREVLGMRVTCFNIDIEIHCHSP